ncbi:Sec-independent protein translocase subunit TatA [Janibacter terrae]|jgi:sec-independent protein translocase protein TatA|nr:Sec-independent protein translocase subunit TatA [Janibacter terrae]MBA4085869.1 twin-arginine translocase TatA/TatE family subunit [Kytococcus sp.]HCE60657.1 twin-arginine translocase TatA/TatE family subunit [Janibacter terrae]
MPSLGPMEIILILLVILLLFGFKKLPDAARSVGKSARVFKAEVNEMKEEDRQREEAKKSRPADTTPTADGNAVIDEAKPRTDNQSGPVA